MKEVKWWAGKADYLINAHHRLVSVENTRTLFFVKKLMVTAIRDKSDPTATANHV